MKKILVPCDFSDTSENALNYAIETAVNLSASLVLVHINHFPVVAPEIGLSSYSYQDADRDSLEALEKLKQKILSNRHFTGPIECFSEMGDVSECIAKYAREQSADLVVMGISGHGSTFMKKVIGSAAVEVGKDLETPVLIIPPGFTYRKPKLMIYACEFEEQVLLEPGVVKMTEIAGVFGATLHLLHVIEEKHEGKFPVQEHYSEHPGAGDIKSYIVHEKHADKAILAFLKDHAADIIAIHPKKHTLLHRLFGHSVTEEVAFNSPVPVLTIH